MLAQRNVYIDDELYAVLRAELAVQLLTAELHDPDTKAVHILGEIRGIWPKSVLNDDAETESLT